MNMKNFIDKHLRTFIYKGLLSIFCICMLLFTSTTVFADYDEINITYSSLLSESQIAIYNQVFDYASRCDDSLFTLATPISEAELDRIMNCFYNDHPEIFWLNTAYRYAMDSTNVVRKLQLKYGITAADLEASKNSYDTIVNTIVGQAIAYTDLTERERFIHDSICGVSNYSTKSIENQSSYSALINGSCACAGYSRAFQDVCNKSGIPCYYITGESLGRPHAWNIVKIDGNYYYVDLTWDDAGDSINYRYFNKSETDFSLDHTLSPLSSELTQKTVAF